MSTALDFRDIRQHPPSTVKAGEPLPADPSWDAHKVYFNERERDKDKKGDEFDDFFVPEDAAVKPFVGPNPADQDSKTPPDETLDPLGWPVDAFRSMGQRVSSLLVYPTAADEDDDNDEDDLNLIRRSDQQPSTAETVLTSLGLADAKSAKQLVEGVQNMFLFSSPKDKDDESPKDDNVLGKEERIRMYETTGVDDESSVEEEEEDNDDWDKDRDVGYMAASADDDDEDVLIVNTTGTAAAVHELTPPTAVVPTFHIPEPAPRKKTKPKGPVPVLRPPPAEKLAKWEQKAKK